MSPVPPFIFMTPEEAKKTDETFKRVFNAAVRGVRKGLQFLALRHDPKALKDTKKELEKPLNHG